MTEPVPNPHAADGIAYGHVFASYTEGTADTSLDLDPYPDERWLSGSVTFRPKFSGQQATATLRVPGTPRSRGLVITELEYKIVNSRLVDRQDREGVWLTVRVGDIPVHWQATVVLRDAAGKVVLTTAYVLTPEAWVHGLDESLTLNLPDLIPNPGLITPSELAAILSAQSAMERSLEVAAVLEEVRPDIVAAGGRAAAAQESAEAAAQQVPLAKAEADRAIGLANAQDVHVAGVLEDPESATHAAFKAVGNATYADKAVEGEVAGKAGSSLVQLSTRTPGAFSPTLTTYAPVQSWLMSDGQTILLTGSAELRYNIDGVGLYPVHTFPTNTRSARETADGEVIVGTNPGDGTPGALFKSHGWQADPTTATWTKVLECVGPNSYFTNHWSLAVEGARVLAVEYGPQDEARYAWLSTDHANTFTRVYDNAVGGDGRRHTHGVAIDPYAGGRLWICTGDDQNNCAIKYSDNNGANWTTFHEGFPQAVSIICTPTAILMSTDSRPNGILRVRRLPGNKLGPLEVAWQADTDSQLTVYGRLIYWRGPGYPVLFSFASKGGGLDVGRIVATDDGGLTFHEIWRDTPDQKAGDAGAFTAIGPTNSGKIIGTVANAVRGTATLSGTAPTWSARPRVAAGRLNVGGVPLAPEALGVEAGPSRIERAFKRSSTSRANSAVPTIDPDLTVAVPAHSTWAVRACLWLSAATEVPDLKISLHGPGGSTGRMHVLGPSSSATNWGAPLIVQGFTLGANQSVGLDDTGFGAFRMEGIVTTGADRGAIYIAWSQNTADATPTVMLDGSWLVVDRIA